MSGDTLRVVGIVPHPERPLAHELARRAAAWFQERGVTVRIPSDVAAPVGLAELGVPLDEFSRGLDLAISLGGDGTMLRTVDLVYECGAAVVGVNVGQMGYLTEVEPVGLDDALKHLLRGEYAVEERMMLEVTVASQQAGESCWWALNEAVLGGRSSRLVRIDVTINGRFFTPYAADAVIIATPTGSTAYSFSARGPIVSPRHRCLLLTPVSPHMLFDRSLVLDPDEELRFTVDEPGGVLLTLDGLERGLLDPGDTVSCTGGPKPARIVTFGQRNFHEILKAKFGLSDR